MPTEPKTNYFPSEVAPTARRGLSALPQSPKECEAG